MCWCWNNTKETADTSVGCHKFEPLLTDSIGKGGDRKKNTKSVCKLMSLVTIKLKKTKLCSEWVRCQYLVESHKKHERAKFNPLLKFKEDWKILALKLQKNIDICWVKYKDETSAVLNVYHTEHAAFFLLSQHSFSSSPCLPAYSTGISF